MFNVYINDIFLFPDNLYLSNYADDTTLYSIGENHKTNRKNLYLYKNGFIKTAWFQIQVWV